MFRSLHTGHIYCQSSKIHLYIAAFDNRWFVRKEFQLFLCCSVNGHSDNAGTDWPFFWNSRLFLFAEGEHHNETWASLWWRCRCWSAWVCIPNCSLSDWRSVVFAICCRQLGLSQQMPACLRSCSSLAPDNQIPVILLKSKVFSKINLSCN